MRKLGILLLAALTFLFVSSTLSVSAQQPYEGQTVIKCNCCEKCKCLQIFQGNKVICNVCKGKCTCCEKCRCYKANFDRTEALLAGNGEYIITGVARKDGPYYRIYLKNGKSIKMAVTSGTELYPDYLKPETAPKLIVKYKNDQGMYQAVQIHNAKFSHIGQAFINGVKVYTIVQNDKK